LLRSDASARELGDDRVHDIHHPVDHRPVPTASMDLGQDRSRDREAATDEVLRSEHLRRARVDRVAVRLVDVRDLEVRQPVGRHLGGHHGVHRHRTCDRQISIRERVVGLALADVHGGMRPAEDGLIGPWECAEDGQDPGRQSAGGATVAVACLDTRPIDRDTHVQEVVSMRSGSRGAMRLTAVLGVTLSLAMGSAAQGQSPSPSATVTTASPVPQLFCALLTIDEVGAALGSAVTISDGTDVDCAWQDDAADGVVALLYARVEAGTVLSDVRAGYPGGTDLMIGDSAAYSLTGSLWVEISGRIVNLRLESAEIADPQAALSALAAVAVARFGSLSIPEQTLSSPGPQPSPVAEVPVKDLFPADLRGPFDEPLDVATTIGAEALDAFFGGDPETRASLEQLVAALVPLGKTLDDVSVGNATLNDALTGLLALRVRGADASMLLPQVTPLIVAKFLSNPGGFVQFGKPRQAAARVGGKDVTLLTPARKSPSAGQAYAYFYAQDDVVWVIIGLGSAKGAVPKDAIQKLP